MDETHPGAVGRRDVVPGCIGPYSRLEKLGANADGDVGSMHPNIFQPLRWVAEQRGAASGGFPNHPKTIFSAGGVAYPDFHGDSQLRDNIAAIAQLRSWAEEARAMARGLVGDKRPDARNAGAFELGPWSGNPAPDALVEILRIWTEVLQRKVATSNTLHGKPGGPLIRFAKACFAALNVDRDESGRRLTADAIRARIRRAWPPQDFQKRRPAI